MKGRMLRDAADIAIANKTGPMHLAFPRGKHARVEQPVIQRADAGRVRINIHAAVFVQNFIAHQISDSGPVAGVSKSFHLPLAAPSQPIKISIAPQFELPCRMLIVPCSNPVVGASSIVAHPNNMKILGYLRKRFQWSLAQPQVERLRSGLAQAHVNLGIGWQ